MIGNCLTSSLHTKESSTQALFGLAARKPRLRLTDIRAPKGSRIPKWFGLTLSRAPLAFRWSFGGGWRRRRASLSRHGRTLAVSDPRFESTGLGASVPHGEVNGDPNVRDPF